MKLNTEQELAANHRDGPCLCTACPGSGKTAVLVERTARMVQSGIAPSSLLCITFTNKAAAEMKERVAKRVGEEVGKKIFISTFHRLCSTILRYHGKWIGYDSNMSILDEDEQIDLTMQAARQMDFELTRPEIKKIVWQVNDWREKLEGDDELYDRFDDIDEPRWAGIAFEYIKRLNHANSIDFSGMLSETVRLLKNFPIVLEAAQKRWKYCFVDETQDTNIAQFEIVNILFSHTRNIFIVGDLDQSIYSFRGARLENITDFTKRYTDATVISLGKNYRSTPQIVKVADTLIRHNPDRIEVEFSTDNTDGPPVQCKAYANDIQEADGVAKQIKSIVNSGNYSYKDVAVFYRINSMSRAIEMAMISNQIPHTVIGNFSFFDRKEVKDCISILRFLVNPKDGIAFHRIANKPKRGLGDTTVGKIEMFAKENTDGDLMEAMRTMHFTSKAVVEGMNEIVAAYSFDHTKISVSESLVRLLDKIRYKEHIDEDEDTKTDRWDNVQELVKDTARFSAEHGPQVSKYLDQVALMSNSDKEADGNAVSLLSLHSSKGLEFPVVFMLGAEQGILPHKRAVEESPAGIDEERRICYVGLTRSKSILSVSYCQRRQEGFAAAKGQVKYKTSIPSQFLYEAGLLIKGAESNQISNHRQGYRQEQWDYMA